MFWRKPPKALKAWFDIVEEPNRLWRESSAGQRITIARNPIIPKGAKIFTMGSCFAMEIRNALTFRGFDVYPKYNSIACDPLSQTMNKVDTPFYDTFTMLQEFQGFEKDFLEHKHRLTSPFGGCTSWQDPHRKKIYAKDEANIRDLSLKIDSVIAEGIRVADVFILTLGLIETWRGRNGTFYCIPPYDADGNAGAKFILSSYENNVLNMLQIADLIRNRPLILTVSPVGLGRTETNMDVVTASIYAKSVLRTVAARVCETVPTASYFPSYELACRDDIFKIDGRHVRQDAVDLIVDAFLKAHLQ